jgi:predicted alpha/beta-fold hydrolase
VETTTAPKWMAAALADLDRRIAAWRFDPHPRVAGGHLQTFAGALWRRRLGHDFGTAEARRIRVAPDTEVLVRCSWLPDRRSRPTVVLVHGLEGCDESCYMRGTADKALAAGWNAVRLNVRNCGGTEHLTPTLYHSGMSADVAEVVAHLVETERLERVAVVGFSLGGNMVLKMAGELGDAAPEALVGVAAVSPAVDLSASAARLEAPENRFYQWRFVRSLRARMLRKDRLFPTRFDLARLEGMRTVRDYDDRYIAPLYGFRDAEDYYERASARHVLGRIRVPALLVHADDDPFIPPTDRVREAARANPLVRFVVTARGGHVGFVGAGARGEDRHWAENRVVEFLEVLEYNRPRSATRNPARALVP